MTSIVRAKVDDYQLLADIGKVSFIQSHGSSADASDINMYLNENYNYAVFKAELEDPDNIYHTVFHDNRAAGYSKIILNTPHSNIVIKNVTKLERFYLLKDFYGLKLGTELMKFNLVLSKNNNQGGMWLYVWVENLKAIAFYKKNGFKVIGTHDFKISETHSNPNYLMFLEY